MLSIILPIFNLCIKRAICIIGNTNKSTKTTQSVHTSAFLGGFSITGEWEITKEDASC